MVLEAAPLAQGYRWLPCLLLCSSIQRSLISCTEPRFFTSWFIQRFYETEEQEVKKWCCYMMHSSPPGPRRPALPHFLQRVSKAREGRSSPPQPACKRKTKAQGREWRAPGLRRPASVYLPRAQGDEPGVLAKGALLYLVHKLGQLGVGPTAVINLHRGKAGDFKDGITFSSILCTSRNAMGDGRREWGKGSQIYKPTAR